MIQSLARRRRDEVGRFVSSERRINKRYCTASLRVDYAHVGLMDAGDGALWIARRRWGVSPGVSAIRRKSTETTNSEGRRDGPLFGHNLA